MMVSHQRDRNYTQRNVLNTLHLPISPATEEACTLYNVHNVALPPHSQRPISVRRVVQIEPNVR